MELGGGEERLVLILDIFLNQVNEIELGTSSILGLTALLRRARPNFKLEYKCRLNHARCWNPAPGAI